MKTASEDLKNLLHTSKIFYMADLFEFVFIDESKSYHTTIDTDIKYNGNIHDSKSLLISRGAIKLSRGVQVDELSLTIEPRTATLFGENWFVAARLGYLDGSRLILKRAFFPNWGTLNLPEPTGTITRFSGRISTIENISRMSIDLIAKSDLELLNVKWPRNVYQPSCLWTLYDNGCKFNRDIVRRVGTIQAGSTRTKLFTNLTDVDNFFNLGVIRLTSGDNYDRVRTIKTYTESAGTINLIYPLTYQPLAGDSFEAWPGCDKQMSTCIYKYYDNIENYRGCPFVPQNETSI